MELSGIKVKLHGIDSRSSQQFREFFKDECDGDFQLTQQQMLADINLVDFDDPIQLQAITQLRQNYPLKPVIVLSNDHYANDDSLVFSLKKPLAQSGFRLLINQISLVISKNASPAIELREALLEHIKTNMRNTITNRNNSNLSHFYLEDHTHSDKVKLATLVGRQNDINIDSPQSIMRILFDPKQLLLSAIQRGISRAKYDKKMIELKNFGHLFVIDPQSESIFTFVSESVLRPLCIMSSNEVSTIKTIKKGRQDPRFDALMNDGSLEIKEWSWHELLWQFGLWTARGKIPKDTDLKLPVTLTQWPNFSRLQLFPHALSIAAIMCQKPIRLDEVASRLGIEQRYVFAFYSAANAAGMAHHSRRQSDNIFQPQSKQLNNDHSADETQSFMARMFGFLAGNRRAQDQRKMQGAAK